MGVLSNSAIIVFFVCIGAKSEAGGWTQLNLQLFRDHNEVIQQALPKIKQQLKLSSIKVLYWKKAHQMKVMGGTKWSIIIDTNDTYGNLTQKQRHFFEVEEQPARECLNDNVVCIKNFVLVDPAVERWLNGNGENGGGPKCELVGGWKQVNIPLFRDYYEVIQQAVPKIKQQLNLSSIEVLDMKKARHMKLSGGRTKWAITIDTNDTNGETTQKQRHLFEVEQKLAGECLNDKVVCIKNFFLVKPEVEQLLLNGIGDKDDGWKQVTNLGLFRDIYDIILQSVAIIKQEFNLTSIEILNWRNAQLVKVMGGTDWKITIDTYDNDGNSAQKQQYTFKVEQRLERRCDNNKVVCILNFHLVRPADNGTAKDDTLEKWQPVPSFDHFRALYQANNLLVHNKMEVWNERVKLLGFVYAKYQQLTSGIYWKIESAIMSPRYRFKGKVGVSIDVFQPKQCELQEETVCFVGYNATGLAIDIVVPLSKSLSTKFL